MAQGQGGFEVPDSWGLAGKVAIVTGGGAAGDGTTLTAPARDAGGSGG